MARTGKTKGSQRSAISHQPKGLKYPKQPERVISLGRKNPLDGLVLEEDVGRAGCPSPPQSGVVGRDALPRDPQSTKLGGVGHTALPNCVYRDDPHGVWLYQGNCLTILDAIYATLAISLQVSAFGRSFPVVADG